MGSIEEMYRQAEHQSQAGPQRIEKILAADYAKNMEVIKEVIELMIANAQSHQPANYKWVEIDNRLLVCWLVYEWSNPETNQLFLLSNGSLIIVYSPPGYSETIGDYAWRHYSVELLAGENYKYPYTHIVGLYQRKYDFDIRNFRLSVIEHAWKEFSVLVQSRWFDSRYEELQFYDKFFGPSKDRLAEIETIANVKHKKTLTRIKSILTMIRSKVDITSSPKCESFTIMGKTCYGIVIGRVDSASDSYQNPIVLLSDGRLAYCIICSWSFFDLGAANQTFESQNTNKVLFGLLKLAKQEFNIEIDSRWFDSELEQLIFEKQTKK